MPRKKKIMDSVVFNNGGSKTMIKPDERAKIQRLVLDEHRPAVDVARELDINPKSLYSWVRQYRSGLLQASLDGEDSVSAEQAEIARLRSELQKSRAEVLLLKKFAAYLSKNGLQ